MDRRPQTATEEHLAGRLAEWRAGVASLYLTGIALGAPVGLAGWLLLRPPPYFDATLGFIAGVWGIFALARALVPPRLSAPWVVALIFATGVAGPYFLGLSAGPFLALMSGVIIGGAVFGRRVGFVLLVIAFCSLSLTGLLTSTGRVAAVSLQPTDPFLLANWVRITVLFTLTAGMLLLVLTGLLARIEEAWRATAVAAAQAQLEQAQRRAMEERAVASQRLEAVGRLAGAVAHDFNNLLVVIMTWADLLPGSQDEAERQEGLDAIRQSAAQAAQLTRQLLSFARKSVTQPRAVDVDAFCAATVKSLRRVVSQDVKIELEPSAAPRVLVDEAQLGQVLLNLAVNAADAMPGGGTLTIRTALLEPPGLPPEAPDPAGRYVAVILSDTGTGMDAATLARAFEPFFSTKAPGHGTGLGLASVYGIATQAHGWVHVESAPGKGSTFTVAFPVAPPDAPSAPTGAHREPPSGTIRHRILLVEDDATVRGTMARALRRAGIEAVEACSADEGLALLRRHRQELELLCTDGVMPGTPTQVLIEGFRSLFPSAPVLVCSGYVEEELVRRGIEEGKVSVLAKPFTAEALVTTVFALLRPPGQGAEGASGPGTGPEVSVTAPVTG